MINIQKQHRRGDTGEHEERKEQKTEEGWETEETTKIDHSES